MKVFIAGASGAIGRRLVPLLHACGYDVVAMTRTPAKAGMLKALGAQPVVADGLDRAAVIDAMLRAEPDVVIHEMTGLSGITDFKRYDETLAATNRLRTEGTDILLEAARAGGARRFIAQSFGLWRYVNGTGDESDPLDTHVSPTMASSVAAIHHLESDVVAASGIVLRYGFLYGPGTGFSHGGSLVGAVRARAFPLIGDGSGVWSFVHVDDAAAATATAVERGRAGIYNVVDDDPAPIAEWLPELADAVGARPPRRLPLWLGRLAAGDGVYMHTRTTGLRNAKARRELGWRPQYASWREGFRDGLGAPSLAAA